MPINIKTCLTYSSKHTCRPSKDEKNSNEPSQMSNHDDRTQKGNCLLDRTTRPMYRENQKWYRFFMKMENGLKLPNGTYPDYEIVYPIIKHFEIGKPSPQLLIYFVHHIP